MVPAQHPCRVFRRHVRQRRDVVRALYHYRRWIAPGFSSILVAPVYPDVGRHLDIHWDARNFHFAVPAFHWIPTDDRDVGSEDRNTRSGPALRRVYWNSVGVTRWKGAHTMMRTPAGHKVYAMPAEYPSAAALYEAAKHVRDAGF